MEELLAAILSYFVLYMAATANPVEIHEGDPKKSVYQIIVNNYGTETNKKLMEENARMNETIWQLQLEIQTLKATCNPDKPNSDKYQVIMADGARWRAFWWYVKDSDWPSNTTDILGDEYGRCDPSAAYCFGRLPEQLSEAGAEMLGKDSAGNIYRWRFDASNPTAHAAWLAFQDHKQTASGSVRDKKTWNPKVVAGHGPGRSQDSFMYSPNHGVVSLLLDDDNCDCYSSLSLGHGMCREGFNPKYGTEYSYGVDLLYDSHCHAPTPHNGLTLYFRDEDDCAGVECGQGQVCIDGINISTCFG